MSCKEHLHGYQPIIHEHFFREKIRSNGRLVPMKCQYTQHTCLHEGLVSRNGLLVAKLFVHILIHEGRFPDSRIAQDDDFQQGFFARGAHEAFFSFTVLT